METRRELRAAHYDFAVDFQGLLKSAMAASAAQPGPALRLPPIAGARAAGRAVLLRTRRVSRAAHVVDRNLELAAACGGGGMQPASALFPLPPGRPEGELPAGDFVLASPLAGWASKQWPMDHYRRSGRAPARRTRHSAGAGRSAGRGFRRGRGRQCRTIPSLAGLIHATRRAAAVVGVDSGPLHLAAALGKPGVAIFGPTDPARNGPYGDSLRVLRTPGAATTYKRGAAIDPSMQNISPDEVFEALQRRDGRAPPSRGKPGRMMRFPKPYADAVARLRVPSGFLIVIVFAWFSRPDAAVDGDRGSALAARPGAARLGGRMPGEEPATRHRRAVRLHAQSAVHRHAAGGGRPGGRRRAASAWRCCSRRCFCWSICR